MADVLWKKPIHYYSYHDEKAFFTWLESIDGVVGVAGCPEGLQIQLESAALPDEALRDLIAIYMRYNGDMTELRQFLTEGNASWFKRPGMYWYSRVFGKLSRPKKS